MPCSVFNKSGIQVYLFFLFCNKDQEWTKKVNDSCKYKILVVKTMATSINICDDMGDFFTETSFK